MAHPQPTPTLAVFASDKGPGDAERASIMSQAGRLLARRGAKLLVLAEAGDLPVGLITSARAAGGEVTIIADDSVRVPSALSEVPIERIAEPEARLARLASLATLYVGLPGSLGSAANLYRAWVRGGSGPGGKPVVLYNHNNAFEFVRGWSADVLSHGIRRHDRYIQFADSLDDLWNKANWLLNEIRVR
ncbi:hypothetical protein EMQ25_09170 [Arsenicitalea aurantiaca]|uniref:AMP nucleosidase n=1 Tax=Arsenicitalea aurantiaca TaxID=1783274 RepID=A0A433XAI2_9HYPH|nr:hypothetical protein [Arsenicitalea aurantiaca]RUT31040.1 hypothetical protein EMQ25_09170 [Arsenicitalea aurantiaca]